MRSCPSCGVLAPNDARFCASCGAPIAQACASCGADLPEGAAFCPSCGTPVAAPASTAEERKVVSVLFADLVGFTARTERSDPEDVRARLTVYHRQVREDVERFGGRIEKLMGDGVFAVFGAPAAHEDDPERAVRSALRIQQEVERLNEADPDLALSVRVAVTTGEAIVALDGDEPDREGIIGDVVNTASRLESVAPPGGVVVDERTYLATRSVITYDDLDAVTVKGKTAPIPIWLASGTRSRFGVAVERDHSTPFVGRDRELALLVDAFERSVASAGTQLATLVGVPGVGKSRMLYEFRQAIDARPDLVWWRQGRCLPYGEGITFWALSEVVKAQAGILESDTQVDARAKLHTAVTNLVDDEETAGWIESRLAPLAGVGSSEIAAEQGELFSALQRFLEALATKNPLILVVEDIHWADEALLDFLEFLLDWTAESPILIVATARPELFTVRPTWAGGKRNAITVGLEPLSHDDAATLLSSLLPRALLPAETQQAILDRAGGNPLFVTEFVRLAADQGLLDQPAEMASMPVPDTVQALVAARVDLLAPEEKSVLQAASVVGKVFWTGILTSMRPELDPAEALRSLVQRELIRPVREGSMRGQQEFSFAHSVIRDVAYGQIPRAERSALHRLAAQWIEAVSASRGVDAAELLAYHLGEALALDLRPDADLQARVYRSLMQAGERARELDATRGAAYFKRAAELATDPVDQARSLREFGLITQDPAAGQAALEEALSLLGEANRPERLAQVLDDLAGFCWWQGDRDRAEAYLQRALELVEGLPASPEKAQVLAGRASALHLEGRALEALEAADAAAPVVKAFGDLKSQMKLLFARGGALANLGDPEGIEVHHEAIRLGADRGSTIAVTTARNNLATEQTILATPTEALHTVDEAIELAAERGYTHAADWARNTRCEILTLLGDFDEIIHIADEVIEHDDTGGGSQAGVHARLHHSLAKYFQGSTDEAREQLHAILGDIRQIRDQQSIAPPLALMFAVESTGGSRVTASTLLDEYEEATADFPEWRGITAAMATRALWHLEDPDRIDRLIKGARPIGTLGAVRVAEARGHLAAARGDVEEAAGYFQEAVRHADASGNRLDATLARIDLAEALGISDPRAEQAAAVARADATDMGARLLVDRLDRIQARSAAAGA